MTDTLSETTNPLLTPGTLLKNARLSKNLSHQEVAAKLKLKPQWILDIEEDQYTRGKALIYVRGYLRAYAQLLGLDSAEILKAFDHLSISETFDRPARYEELLLQKDIVTRSGKRKLIERRWIYWVGISLGILLILLTSLWWGGEKNHTSSTSAPASETSTQSTNLPLSAQPQSPVQPAR